LPVRIDAAMELNEVVLQRRSRIRFTEQEIQAFNQRASQNESLVGRSLFSEGITWPGVLLWDDIRTLDYLAARPGRRREQARVCWAVGRRLPQYSAGGARPGGSRRRSMSVWMTSFASQLKEHVIHTVGLSFSHQRPLSVHGFT
jgi:hypothetical protein